mgnify:FL=1
MKNLFPFLLIFTLFSTAQVTNEGQPLSWDLNLSKRVVAKELPAFDMNLMNDEDAVNDNKKNIPFRFGYMHSVDYGFEDGVWTNLENGDRIWRILISSDGALSLNFIFDDFFIPEGGSLYLYNNDRSDLLGAYTSTQNQENGILGTWMVNGDKVWIEYYEPAVVNGQGRLHIAKATHRYRGLQKPAQTKSLGDSDTCNVDVDCAIGDDYDYIKDHNKRSVALINLGNSICTGTLINNTTNDGTPYFLTADHCYSNPSQWSFLFGWISPDPSCATTQGSTNGSQSMTMSSASLKSRYESTDFLLVEINSQVPDSWDRVYAGWDKTDNTPDFTVGIHHPAGDIMKVSRDDDSPQKLSVNYGDPFNIDVWNITSAGGGWEMGITAGGSSGSALFDQTGKVIGQLLGGASFCQFTGSSNDNGGGDDYGRFGLSWEGNGTSSTRLRDWLDPSGTNTGTLNSFPELILETFDYDLELESIDSPNSGALSSEETIVVTISNNGDQSVSEFEITYQVNGGTLISENYTETLSSGQTVQYPFTETYDFSEAGQYEITASITLSNDEDNSNNSISKTVTNTPAADCDPSSLPYFNGFSDVASWEECNTFIDSDGDGNGWSNVSYTIDDGNMCVASASYDNSAGALNPDNWVIIGPIDLTNESDVMMEWKVRGLDPDWCQENYSVYVGTEPTIENLTSSSVSYTETISGIGDACGNAFAQRSLDISAAGGTLAYIGFRHHDVSDMFVLNIDDLSIFSGSMSVQDPETLEMNIYPNPVNGNFVTIQTPVNGVKYVELFDITGKRLINTSLITDTLEVSSLSAGLYLIKVTVEGQSKTSKLIVR